MKVLERQNFLQKLINSINTPDIKVITGIRRSGKSKLLEMFIEYLKSNIPNTNIIHINYNLFQFSTLKNAAALNEYVENLYSPEKENFLLIDEVQLCKDFEQYYCLTSGSCYTTTTNYIKENNVIFVNAMGNSDKLGGYVDVSLGKITSWILGETTQNIQTQQQR